MTFTSPCVKIRINKFDRSINAKGFKMNKRIFKRVLTSSLVIFIGLALAITYFFILYKKDSLSVKISSVITILRPFIIGMVLAYIMKSTCNLYEKLLRKPLSKSKKRTPHQSRKLANLLAVTCTYITWTVLISALLWIVIPQIVESITKFINDMVVAIPDWVDKIFEFEQKFLADNETLRPYFDSVVNWLITWSETDLIPYLRELGASILPALLNVLTIVKDIVIGLIISVFFLLGRKELAAKSKIFIHCIFKEKSAKAILSEFRYADRMFSGFLEGKVIDSSIVGLAYYIFLVAVDIPYPALIAVICGVTNIIPFFGPFIGAIPSGLIILVTADSPIKLLWFVIFVFVAQFIDGYIIDPHIVGGNIKMSSFSVLFSVILFGGLWGFWGLLIGVPTFAVIYDIGKKIVIHTLKKKGKIAILEKYYKDFDKAPKNNSDNTTSEKQSDESVVEVQTPAPTDESTTDTTANVSSDINT